MKPADPVDVVVTWVDDSDASWRNDRDRIRGGTSQDVERNTPERYRDWGALRYFFRALEQNCSWARYIHFVTVNPVPVWVNKEHPKLRVVHHRDFIPEGFLPTFNSRAIEVHLHKIPDLSENFIYVNDDTYITRKIGKEHFFPKQKPAAMAISNALSIGDNISHAILNNIRVINNHFDKKRVILRSPFKWLNPTYGVKIFQNVALLPWPKFTGFHISHLPQALRKSTMRKVWDVEHLLLEETANSRFRQFTDLNPYLFTYWDICTGQFTPVSPTRYGRYFQIGQSSVQKMTRSIAEGRIPIICINDGESSSFASDRNQILGALARRFPTQSSFEMDNG
ncbi:Stealth CR1 domain-containing protein [Paramicrobacterium chengjingii]|uniref:Stealth CR1 domain-containing protein n=1 Tax=Paramicrobacterium chengjingii TaxID=2769067 RepID=A0ABX6YFA6_9MICO|nr:Stealth CR1 domain-containing protein [Microbacterium chengjingii]QPZ37477.1 Stealth CR1 domain-containing protein [Microbacterium chengjingii]